MKNCRYQVGGSLNYQDVNYVERVADSQLYEALKQGEFCYIFNSRQMGKSSLLVKTKHRLELEDFATVAIDLTGIGSEQISPEQWYKGFIYQVYLGLETTTRVNLKKWWLENQDISLVQRLNNFLIEVILPHIGDRKLIIFIDEIDSVFKLPFSSDDFFAFIRFCYNQRGVNDIYKRLTFALFGVATPSQLIRDSQRTPFNIGQSIELTGFNLDEAKILTRGLNYSPKINNLILESILFWTEGQPFLTQKLCQLVEQNKPQIIELDEVENIIQNVVKESIFKNWEQQDDPEHLRTISNRLLYRDEIVLSVLSVYQEILWEYQVERDNSIEQQELLLSGLVVKSQGILQVKNRIYQNIFNLKWIEEHLAHFRPYNIQLNNWLKSQQQDSSQLLTDEALKYALEWSKNKRISNLDYQFIGASQKLAQQKTEYYLNLEKIAKEKVEIALDAANQAHRILAELKLKARQKARNFCLPNTWAIAIAAILTIILYLSRSVGIFQASELKAFDYLMSTKLLSSNTPPITVISIDETDLQNFKTYPISDSLLAQAIEKILTREPQVIGLDIYRDLPVQPGSKELEKVLIDTPNIVGVEKIIGNKINPSPTLAKKQQVGFNDLALDSDNKVRRAILSYQLDREPIQYSFALKLALNYLSDRKIRPEYIDRDDTVVRLGKSIFYPLNKNSGSYINAKAKGYQILLNYYGTDNYFPTFSFSDLLSNKVPESRIDNCIVLIGARAESLNDFFATSYNHRISMPGIYIHANLINQIVSSATTGQGTIKTWNDAQETIWIAIWIAIAVFFTRQVTLRIKLYCSIAITIFSLLIITYLAWIIGWWIPIVPSLIGVVMAVITTILVTERQRKQKQLHYAVQLLINAGKTKPAASQIALEYLKIGESPQRIQKISNMLAREAKTINN